MAPNIFRLMRAGLLLIVFAILLSTAYLAGLGNAQKIGKDAYNAGYEAALEERGLTPPADVQEEEAPEPITVVGIVQSATADTLTITEELPGSSTPGPTRLVIVGDGGVVVGLEAKDPAVLEQELDAYNRERQRDPNNTAPPPAPEEQRTIALSDLRSGDRVTLTTLDPDSDPIVAERITRTATASQ
ncbi:hypothetical protein EPO33_02155 [Patescibacteria group bacterium]|nr:MAG: hypothetical protein EPO33_02155 [Patescibacteria group bacterium]